MCYCDLLADIDMMTNIEHVYYTRYNIKNSAKIEVYYLEAGPLLGAQWRIYYLCYNGNTRQQPDLVTYEFNRSALATYIFCSLSDNQLFPNLVWGLSFPFTISYKTLFILFSQIGYFSDRFYRNWTVLFGQISNFFFSILVSLRLGSFLFNRNKSLLFQLLYTQKFGMRTLDSNYTREGESSFCHARESMNRLRT